ncbi:hypothetical protein G3M81_23230 [Bacillus paralicheniformis]|uniref:hypothetical protein n=1 Tax=Bacillus TaxID=1386 RepID=UPI0013EED8E2|nr:MULTISPECIES: hypothetical protein [Bacillus]QII26909.1 hypothetical protein G3M80_20645 [Bacillus altitudinis]QII51474.1 hypothetical protein G3M81_23230 [Bacillus paralicheniformis]
MDHIYFAVNVLQERVAELNNDLYFGHNTPDRKEEIMNDLQKINTAIRDILEWNKWK